MNDLPMFSSLWTLPTPAAFIVALLLFHVLFTVLGLGATLIVIPARLSKYTLVFAPLIGLCVVTWLGWRSLWLDFAGTDASAVIICGIACSLLVVPILRVKSRVHASVLFDREVLIAFGIALCGALAVSIPVLAEPHLTTISAGNADVASYALDERFLMSHSIHDLPGNIDEYLKVAQGIVGSVFGVYFASAMAGSVLGLQSYQLQNVAISAYVLSGGLVFYVLARELFRFRPLSSAILLAGLSFGEVILYVALHGYKAQLAAMALAGSVYCWIIPALARDSPPGGRELAGTTLLSWGLAAVYPHMLPVVFVPLGFYSVALAIRARSVRRLRWPALAAAVVVAGIVALSPFRAASVYRYAILMKEVTAGWFLPWISPASFLGVTGITAFSHRQWPLEAVLAVLCIGAILAGMFLTRRREPDVFLVALTFVVVIGGAYGCLVVTGRNASGLGGYKSFKLLSFFVPVLWCSALLLLREPHPHPLVRRSQAVLAVALLAGNLVAGGRWIETVRTNHVSVPPEMVELTKLETDSRIASLDIVTSNFWDGMWATTFLFHKVLYHKYSTYYPAAARLRGDWTLEDGTARVLTVEPCHPAPDIRVNDRFVVVASRSPEFSVHWDRGWHDDQRTHRWTAEQVASIRIRSRSRERVRISLAYSPLNSENGVSLRLNGEPVDACSRLQTCDFAASLEEGDNRLEFVSLLPPERPKSDDPRRLGLSFSRIRISETACGISSR